MLAPKLPSFFKIPRPNHFDYKPFYYNEQKEQLKRRYEDIKREVADTNNNGSQSRIQLNASYQKWEQRREYKKLNRQANVRLLIIIAILCFILLLLAMGYPAFISELMTN